MMKINWIKIALIWGWVWLLGGCSQMPTRDLKTEPDRPATSSSAGLSQPEAVASPIVPSNQATQKDGNSMLPTTPSPVDAGLQSLIEQAKQDLAQRLSIPITQISLVEAKNVVWPDASLGCPQPGMAYIQVPKDGSLIVLQANGINYEYHYGGNRGLFLCEKPTKDPEAPTQLDIQNLTPPALDKNSPTPSAPDNGIPPGEGK